MKYLIQTMGMVYLLLVTFTASAQEPNQILQLTLKSDKQTFSIDENVNLKLTINNLSSQEIRLFEGGHFRTIVILDGKDYKNTGAIAWGGPGSVSPKGEIGIGIGLGAYGITKDILAAGKHQIAVKFNGAISNAITIQIDVPKRSIEKQ